MKKFKTESGYIISTVEVLRETKRSVFVAVENIWGDFCLERKDAKVSQYVQYHDTWDEAHDYLLERAFCRLEEARLQLAESQIDYVNVKGMKKPEDA